MFSHSRFTYLFVATAFQFIEVLMMQHSLSLSEHSSSVACLMAEYCCVGWLDADDVGISSRQPGGTWSSSQATAPHSLYTVVNMPHCSKVKFMNV